MQATTIGKLILCLSILTPLSILRAEASPSPTQSVSINVSPSDGRSAPAPELRFTGRFTTRELKPLITDRIDLLPLPFQFPTTQKTMIDSLERISMYALVDKLEPYLKEKFPTQFDSRRDVIRVPVPEEKQIEREQDDIPRGKYTGPTDDISGFLLHDITENDYINVAVLVMQTAYQLLESGDPVADRTVPNYYEIRAEQEISKLRQAQKANQAREKESQSREMHNRSIRYKIGEALGVYDPVNNTFGGEPNWVNESRQFAYIVNDGKFIARLDGLVKQINDEIKISGFKPPGLDEGGIHYDKDLNEVVIVLPRPLMRFFLQEADRLERRMAEDHMISIEAVRITDREIVDGALAARLNVDAQGVHNVHRLDQKWVRQQLGLNTLLAVANRQLDISNRQQIEAGVVPEGTKSVVIPGMTMPVPKQDRLVTNIGGRFSVGADDMFFDGREQRYGFSYIGPDGLRHTLSLDIVDSLREMWNRIERNLIVHKIKKTDEPTNFTVPVGPDKRTFRGIAALISQENRDIVITQEGSLVRLSATAGTWLVIQDFEIEPTPGSSTSLTSDEQRVIEDRVLLTMFLRDPTMDVCTKIDLVETQTGEELHQKMRGLYEKYKNQSVRPGRAARTYEVVFENRKRETLDDAAVEKKEENSQIKLTFYSSQGNIIYQPGITALGDANDLTSFTTELRPNVVTPISSFFTKAASGAKGSSPLTGVAKGEQSQEEKTMAHLVVRARFPTVERERSDLQEGRYMGYFDLPLGKNPYSKVDLPFLSSSDHPLARLSKFRFGLIFPALQSDQIRRPFSFTRPNTLMGTISPKVWELATTRLLMNRKIITNSPGAEQHIEAQYRERFIVEVRSLLEYDEDFFAAPKIALRNMDHWNDPERIVYALYNSSNQFALDRLIKIIDELGDKLVPVDYAENYLAHSPSALWARHELHPLTPQQRQTLARDVANHYLRIMEVYGDAFHEAVSIIFSLGSYRETSTKELESGPFRGYRELVVFDSSSIQDPELIQQAHEEFLFLKDGGYKGKLFEPSMETIQDMKREHRQFVIRGSDIIDRTGNYNPN